MVIREIALAVVLICYPSVVWGDDPCVEQDYDSSEGSPDFDCPSPGELELVPDLDPKPSLPMESGTEFVTAWDGAYVDGHRLVEVGLRIKAIRRLRWLDRIQLSEENRLRLEHARQIVAVQVAHSVAQLAQYQESLNRANERARKSNVWYRSWPFGFVVGVVSAAVVTFLGIYLGVTI